MLQRLQKIIAASGITSRRKAEELIEQGRVLVNGVKATIGQSADPAKDKILVDGSIVSSRKKIYAILHKPKEVIVAKHDPDSRKTIYELPSVINLPEPVIHVGRLDYMSEGLLLLTNDGDFANKMMHPRYEVEKTYQLRVEPILKPEDAEKIVKGLYIDGKKTSPAQIEMLEKNLFEITLHEGRNRIIRKIMESLGYKVYMLKRVRIGRLGLGKLKPGEVRLLAHSELGMLMKN